jgi:APA family basic amino acid/polyamine antiporter
MGAPYMSIILQGIISLCFIFTATFDWIINYIGITLSIFATLTVAGIFVIRKRFKSDKIPIKTIGYPVTPLFFIFFNLSMIWFLSLKNPVVLFSSLFTIFLAWVLYYFMRKKNEIG